MCEYYRSAQWWRRVWSHLNRSETIESFVDTYTKRTDIEAILDAIQVETGTPYRELLNADVESVLRDVPAEVIGIDVESVPEVWAAIQSFPTECPRDAYGDSEFCALHLPIDEKRERGISSSDVAARVMAQIEDDEEPNRFVGITAETLALENTSVGTVETNPIDLRLANIERELSLEGTHLNVRIDMEGVTTRTANFDDADFAGGVNLDMSHCREFTSAENADFRDHATFEQSLHSQASFVDAHFLKEANFEAVEFTGSASFQRAKFEGRGYFKLAAFQRTIFKRAQFEAKGSFKCAQFDQMAEFPRVSFFGKASFKFAEFGEKADFEVALFDGEARFWDVFFGGRAWFTDSSFRHIADFSDVVFAGNTDKSTDGWAENEDALVAVFNDADFARIQFQATSTTGIGVISLYNATIEEGHVSQPGARTRSLPTYYDMTKTRVGDIRLGPKTDRNLFDSFKILRTEFYNFDFGNHRKVLNRNWQITDYGGPDVVTETNDLARDRYRVTPGAGPDESGSSVAALEETFLKARNGAEDSGDTKAAAEFFLREMKFRRKSHWQNLSDRERPLFERAKSAGRWVANWSLNVSCGYGERPWRTIASSLAVVFMFIPVYLLMGVGSGTDTGLLQTLAFSFQVFVTIIFGNTPAPSNPVVAIIGAFQGFVGAFFIALFVFALTRSVRR